MLLPSFYCTQLSFMLSIMPAGVSLAQTIRVSTMKSWTNHLHSVRLWLRTLHFQRWDTFEWKQVIGKCCSVYVISVLYYRTEPIIETSLLSDVLTKFQTAKVDMHRWNEAESVSQTQPFTLSRSVTMGSTLFLKFGLNRVYLIGPCAFVYRRSKGAIFREQ